MFEKERECESVFIRFISCESECVTLVQGFFFMTG